MYKNGFKLIFLSCIFTLFACKSISTDSSGLSSVSNASVISLADIVDNFPVEEILYNDKGTIFIKTSLGSNNTVNFNTVGFESEKVNVHCDNQELYSSSGSKRSYQVQGKAEFYAVQTDMIKKPSTSSWRAPSSLQDIKIRDYFTVMRCSNNYGMYSIREELVSVKIRDLLDSGCKDKAYVGTKQIYDGYAGNYEDIGKTVMTFRSKNPNCLNFNFKYDYSNFHVQKSEGGVFAIGSSSKSSTVCDKYNLDSDGTKDGYTYYNVVLYYQDHLKSNLPVNNLQILDQKILKIYNPLTFIDLTQNIVGVIIFKCTSNKYDNTSDDEMSGTYLDPDL